MHDFLRGTYAGVDLHVRAHAVRMLAACIVLDKGGRLAGCSRDEFARHAPRKPLAGDHTFGVKLQPVRDFAILCAKAQAETLLPDH